MIASFRFVLVLALIAAAVALCLPFAEAVPFRVPVDRPTLLTGLVLLGGLGSVVSGVLVAVSTFGLLRFRGWARALAWWATALVAVSASAMAAVTPIYGALSSSARVLFLVAVAAWFAALALMYTRPVRARFLVRR
ncbi:hypothetical protein [Oleiagrimonas soli]|uniref:Uncharacterized protein n=1 Tax=Oleiagrimonas soli TaxID=1543381 RepID=A0A099CYU5_9GAMM|nr:hypothetical protein [Oleiagrimonas soli]KGI79148.1 hypothetical protein LF63_0100405 [Oleiagrimonas soli]MBB6184820.1 hypothetical protein [Oleiagrimonas soli]